MTLRDVIGNIYHRPDIGLFCIIGHHQPEAKFNVWVIDNGDLGRILIGQFLDGLRNGDVRFEARLADVVYCLCCAGDLEIATAQVSGEERPALVCGDCGFVEDLMADTIPMCAAGKESQ